MTKPNDEALFAASPMYGMGSVYSSLSVAVFGLSSRSPSILAVWLFLQLSRQRGAFAPQNSEEIKTLHEYLTPLVGLMPLSFWSRAMSSLPFQKQLDALHRDIAAIDVKVGHLESRLAPTPPKAADSGLKMTKTRLG